MATISFTTTPALDAALVTLRHKINAGREVPLTAGEFKDYIIAQWTDSLEGQAGEHSRTSVREAYASANQTTQVQIRALLGVS